MARTETGSFAQVPARSDTQGLYHFRQRVGRGLHCAWLTRYQESEIRQTRPESDWKSTLGLRSASFKQRGEPQCYAFNLLWFDGEDLQSRPLVERKRLQRSIAPEQSVGRRRRLGRSRAS